mmetsp:Transcript_6045/g.13066  ORF Transcript_6045/g.13066 Transcript_6045/m.13066 type:complete len:253 (+) Transcript_6045:105-863(+)
MGLATRGGPADFGSATCYSRRFRRFWLCDAVYIASIAPPTARRPVATATVALFSSTQLSTLFTHCGRALSPFNSFITAAFTGAESFEVSSVYSFTRWRNSLSMASALGHSDSGSPQDSPKSVTKEAVFALSSIRCLASGFSSRNCSSTHRREAMVSKSALVSWYPGLSPSSAGGHNPRLLQEAIIAVLTASLVTRSWAVSNSAIRPGLLGSSVDLKASWNSTTSARHLSLAPTLCWALGLLASSRSSNEEDR